MGLGFALAAGLGVAITMMVWPNEPIEPLEWQSSGGHRSELDGPADPVREPLRADLAPPPGEVGVEPLRDPRARAWAEREPSAILRSTWIIGSVREPTAEPQRGRSEVRLRARAGDPSRDVVGAVRPDGRFALELLQRGSFEIVASSAAATSAPVPVEGAQGRTIDVGELELVPRVEVVGRVIDASGRGVPSATVRGGDVSTTTDAAGLFHLDVGAGRVELEAIAPGLGRGELAVIAPSAAPCVVVLAPAAVVTGVVVDAAGAAVDACEVRCDGMITRTDERGAFRFAASRADRPFVVARHARRGAGSGVFDGSDPLRITLDRTASVVVSFDRELGAEAREVLVELLRESASGIVAEPATFGIESAWLGATSVRIAGLAAGGEYRVRLYGGDGACASTTLSIPIPAPEFELATHCTFERGGPIDVRVVDAAGHAAPAAIVTIGAFDDVSADVVNARSAVTDADGNARFLDRPAQEHVVRVVATGRSDASAHVARASIAGDARTITVVLRGSSRVAGTLPRPATAAAAPWIRASSRDETRWARASAAGTFAFESLAAEPWEFVLWPATLPRTVGVHAGPMLPVQVLELDPGRSHALTFTEDVSRAIALPVHVIDESGSPCSGVRVSAWLDTAEVATTRSAADGRAELVLPSVGRYTVRAQGDRESDPSAQIEDVSCEGRTEDVLRVVVHPRR